MAVDPKKTVAFEELLINNMYEQEALINLFEKKGFITKQELLVELKRLQAKSRLNAD